MWNYVIFIGWKFNLLNVHILLNGTSHRIAFGYCLGWHILVCQMLLLWLSAVSPRTNSHNIQLTHDGKWALAPRPNFESSWHWRSQNMWMERCINTLCTLFTFQVDLWQIPFAKLQPDTHSWKFKCNTTLRNNNIFIYVISFWVSIYSLIFSIISRLIHFWNVIKLIWSKRDSLFS